MKELFCETNGQLSMTRAMCFIALVVAIVATFTSRDYNITLTWIAAAFGGKIGGKLLEEKNG